MKIVIKKQIEETVDVKLPAHYEHGSSIYCIKSEQNYIDVGTNENDPYIRVQNTAYKPLVDLILSNGRPVDKACFKNVWQRAVSAINKMDREMKGWDEIHQEHLWEQSHELRDDNKDCNKGDEEMFEKYGHEAKEFEL